MAKWLPQPISVVLEFGTATFTCLYISFMVSEIAYQTLCKSHSPESDIVHEQGENARRAAALD